MSVRLSAAKKKWILNDVQKVCTPIKRRASHGYPNSQWCSDVKNKNRVGTIVITKRTIKLGGRARSTVI